jgi:hypothetical protein
MIDDFVVGGAAENEQVGWVGAVRGGDNCRCCAVGVAGLFAVLPGKGRADGFKHRQVVGDVLWDRLVGETGVGAGSEGSGATVSTLMPSGSTSRRSTSEAVDGGFAAL